MRRLAHSVVVVTGASGGIGRATARAFASHGAAVVVNARRKQALERVADECREAGGQALAVAGDVTDASAMEALAREAIGHFGRIDVWVNNAAVQLYAPLEEAPPDEWRRVIDTNVVGTYHGLRAALPWLREQGSGTLINVSSVLGKAGAPYQSAYVASKHAVRALSDCLRQELLDVDGIQVCTVLPGPVDTPLFDSAANYTGRRVKPIQPVIAAGRVADAIVGCARRPRREVVVGSSTRTALGFARIAPALAERIIARQVARDHFTEQPAPPQSGNLLEPSDDAGAVSGGWSRRSHRLDRDDRRAASNDGGPRRLVTLAAVGVAGAAAGAVVRARRA